MYTEKKRIIIVIITAVLLNLMLFLLAYYLELPLWLDTTGTIYAALILGFPAGFIVAIVNNVSQALFFYGLESLRFYLVSALTALLTGIIATKFKHRRGLKWFLLTLALLVLGITLAIILNFWAYGGIPADHWGNKLYYDFLADGLRPWQSTLLSVSIVKFMDVIVSVVLVAIAHRITPKAIREPGTAIIQ